MMLISILKTRNKQARTELSKTTHAQLWILADTLNDVKWMFLNGFSPIRKFNAKNVKIKLYITLIFENVKINGKCLKEG